MKNITCLGFLIALQCSDLLGQNIKNNPQSNHGNRFEQLGTILPDANNYRTASGAPGHQYWQMRADYQIDARLDEENLKLYGSEWVHYYNNSPDVLPYLWLQLDENEHHPNSSNNYSAVDSKTGKQVSEGNLKELDRRLKLEGYGVNIEQVTDADGKAMKYFIHETMMRIDLPKPLRPGSKIKFFVRWNYKIPDRMDIGGRGGYEFFNEDGNHLFTMSQWFPRLCVYSDFQGWQHKQFTGRGEFALPFGNYEVRMTVPADHIVAATGECQNYKQVLNTTRYRRWEMAQKATEPIEVVTLEEAKQAERNKSQTFLTWVFKANNVRDFAWGSSRKFVWDAMPIFIEGKKTMCMSYYAKEAYGLYRKFSTKTIAHTIQTYSHFSIPYPYPVAISVEASNGMEYPMICFNFGRTEKDGSYSEGTKNGMLGVVIHEVGHNFFPMIVNSDERQWTWMDEGLNTFVQTLTQELFDYNFPAGRGAAANIVDYMKLDKSQLEPIMTNSENLIHFGQNAYAKTATGLNILRETILGRERFDLAFREYARRWAFKHPTPADFFRSMEDASGEDLDWFWRAWFFDIEPVDIAIDSVSVKLANAPAPSRKVTYYWQQPSANETISKFRNRTSGYPFLVDRDTSLRDFYYHYQSPRATPKVAFNYHEATSDLQKGGDSTYLYEVHFSNKGGMVMPIIIRWNYADSTFEDEKLSVQIWRKNEQKCIKTFFKNKKVQSIQLDPFLETADIDTDNQQWKIDGDPERIELLKSPETKRNRRRGGGSGASNPMQQSQQQRN